MRNIKRSGLFGRVLAEALGRKVRTDTPEHKAEVKVQAVIRNAPKNRDTSKDRFLHREVGRIPIFTLKRRKAVMPAVA